MQYLSERDGKVFDTAEECLAHENEIDAERLLINEAAVYVDSLKDDAGHVKFDGRARTREINTVVGWLRYDMDKHPDRYYESAVVETDEVAEIREAS